MRQLALIAVMIAGAALPACMGDSGSEVQPAQSRAIPKTIYEIFTRSFQDSDGDGVGDLNGITSRLDYLSELGVDAIWLTPIYPSPSYHGYDITDYEQVKKDYGDLDGLRRLLSEAHQRGIRVLLDIAVNHTSDQHPWFQDHSLYLWSPEPLDWPDGQGKWYAQGGQYYYSSFDPAMPDLNWRDPQVLARIQKVFEFWVGMGVDGFRLDAAKFLVKGPQGQQNTPETHQIWQEIVTDARKRAPNTYFVGEVWDSARNIAGYYGKGDELDAAFDFPVMEGLRSSLTSRSGDAFAKALEEQVKVEPTGTFAAPFVGNHDIPRLASLLNGDFARMKLAAAAFLSLPGSAVVYYGDEIGIAEGSSAGAPGDLGKRTPMQWDGSANRGFSGASPWVPISTSDQAVSVQAQQQDPGSLWHAYQSLIALRARYPELAGGEISAITEPAPGLVSYVRSQKILVVLNFSDTDLSSIGIPLDSATLSSGSPGSATSVSSLYGSAQATLASGMVSVSIPRSSAALFLIH